MEPVFASSGMELITPNDQIIDMDGMQLVLSNNMVGNQMVSQVNTPEVFCEVFSWACCTYLLDCVLYLFFITNLINSFHTAGDFYIHLIEVLFFSEVIDMCSTLFKIPLILFPQCLVVVCFVLLLSQVHRQHNTRYQTGYSQNEQKN